jgi:hypothetical protein
MMTLEGNYRPPRYDEAKKNTRNRGYGSPFKAFGVASAQETSGQAIAADTFRHKLLDFYRRFNELRFKFLVPKWENEILVHVSAKVMQENSWHNKIGAVLAVTGFAKNLWRQKVFF